MSNASCPAGGQTRSRYQKTLGDVIEKTLGYVIERRTSLHHLSHGSTATSDGSLHFHAAAVPTQKVVGIHAVDLVWGLSTLHCMTQQEPAGGAAG
jgi:Porphyromonas-type peptidyl-arginine deiminase